MKLINMAEEEVRCWVCRRTEKEVENWLNDCAVDIETLKKRRSSYDVDNWGISAQNEDGLIQLASSEWLEPHIPLCVICQGLLLYQAAAMTHEVIENKLADRELMKYTEYKIVPIETSDDPLG